MLSTIFLLLEMNVMYFFLQIIHLYSLRLNDIESSRTGNRNLIHILRQQCQQLCVAFYLQGLCHILLIVGNDVEQTTKATAYVPIPVLRYPAAVSLQPAAVQKE